MATRADGVPPARIAVVERGARDGSGSAAYVAAAMLAPLAEAAVADRFVVELGLASLTLWRDWLPMLRTPVFFQQAGTLVVWHPADRGEASLFANHVRAATPPERIAADLRAVDAEGIGTLEPALAQRFSQGLYLAGEGRWTTGPCSMRWRPSWRPWACSCAGTRRLPIRIRKRWPPPDSARASCSTAGASAPSRNGRSCAACAARWRASMRPMSRSRGRCACCIRAIRSTSRPSRAMST